VGAIPQGLPRLGVEDVFWTDLRVVLPLAIAWFLLSYVEGISVARAFAARDRVELDPDRELFALGAVNLAAGLVQGFVVGGSGSRSAVSDEAGARSPLAGGIAAGLLLVVVLFLAGFLANLPDPILAAVVLVAVRRLMLLRELRALLAVSKWEFAVASLTLAGVLVFGLLDGVAIGFGFLLIDLLRRVSAPTLALLGRIPNTGQFMELARHAECERVPGVLVCRVDGPLFFPNARAVESAILQRLAEQPEPPAAVVLDLGGTSTCDLSTAEMLEDLAGQLAERGVRLELVDLSELAWDILSRRGLPARFSNLGRHFDLGDAVARPRLEVGGTPTSAAPD
jgi:SulP family sulfate permease